MVGLEETREEIEHLAGMAGAVLGLDGVGAGAEGGDEQAERLGVLFQLLHRWRRRVRVRGVAAGQVLEVAVQGKREGEGGGEVCELGEEPREVGRCEGGCGDGDLACAEGLGEGRVRGGVLVGPGGWCLGGLWMGRGVGDIAWGKCSVSTKSCWR